MTIWTGDTMKRSLDAARRTMFGTEAQAELQRTDATQGYVTLAVLTDGWHLSRDAVQAEIYELIIIDPPLPVSMMELISCVTVAEQRFKVTTCEREPGALSHWILYLEPTGDNR